MKRQIPGRVPRIFPLVRHGDDVAHSPCDTTRGCGTCPDSVLSTADRCRFLQPLVDVQAEVLLSPQHPGQGLAHDAGFIFRQAFGDDAVVKVVRFTLRESPWSWRSVLNGSPILSGAISLRRRRMVACLPASTVHLVIRSSLRALLLGIERVLFTVDKVIVKRVFYVRTAR